MRGSLAVVALLALAPGCFRPTLARRCVGERVVDGVAKFDVRWLRKPDVMAALAPERAARVKRALVLHDVAEVATFGTVGGALTFGLFYYRVVSPGGYTPTEIVAGTLVGIGLAAVGSALLEAWQAARVKVDRTLDEALLEDLPGCSPAVPPGERAGESAAPPPPPAD